MIADDMPVSRIGRALDRIRRSTGVSLAFGGEVLDSGDLALEHFSGPTLGALPGVTLKYDAGLGGRAVALRRPIAVNDYFQSDRISHHYDRIIRAEGLRSLVAAPVVLDRRPVGVLYAAFRNDEIIGGRILDSLIDEARLLEHELVTLQAIRNSERTESKADVERLRGQVRSAYTDLRALSGTVSDPELQRALRTIAEKLGEDRPSQSNAVMTRRETDVLALVAAGLTNQEIAHRLGLTLFTVKGYVKTVMSKFSARTRLEAVVRARADGLLP